MFCCCLLSFMSYSSLQFFLHHPNLSVESHWILTARPPGMFWSLTVLVPPERKSFSFHMIKWHLNELQGKNRNLCLIACVKQCFEFHERNYSCLESGELTAITPWARQISSDLGSWAGSVLVSTLMVDSLGIPDALCTDRPISQPTFLHSKNLLYIVGKPWQITGLMAPL